MLNKKVILLSGYARGGTNITWNILQSHPDICSPVHETANLFKKSFKLRACQYLGKYIDCSRIIDRELLKFKLSNLEHPDNKFISEGTMYTAERITQCALCLKSVNEQIFYTDLLLKTYPDLYFIALTRNGYALADGYVRRGMSIKYSGKLYQRMAEEMRRLSGEIKNFKLLKFEDVVKSSFIIAEELFYFTEMDPKKVNKLRFKSKKVITNDGGHNVKFGEEHRKYWVDEKNIRDFIDPEIDEKQSNRLSLEMIKEFNKEAKAALEYFGYDVL